MILADSLPPAISAAAIELIRNQLPEQWLLDIVTRAPHDVSPTLWLRVKSDYSEMRDG